LRLRPPRGTSTSETRVTRASPTRLASARRSRVPSRRGWPRRRNKHRSGAHQLLQKPETAARETATTGTGIAAGGAGGRGARNATSWCPCSLLHGLGAASLAIWSRCCQRQYWMIKHGIVFVSSDKS
jgi:hypothetical protein